MYRQLRRPVASYYCVFVCAEIDRQMQEIQNKRKRLNEQAEQQEKVNFKYII